MMGDLAKANDDVRRALLMLGAAVDIDLAGAERPDKVKDATAVLGNGIEAHTARAIVRAAGEALAEAAGEAAAAAATAADAAATAARAAADAAVAAAAIAPSTAAARRRREEAARHAEPQHRGRRVEGVEEGREDLQLRDRC